MFADPQSLTFGGTSISFSKVRFDNYSSEYKFADATQEITFLIRNTPPTLFKKTGRQTSRHNVEVIVRIFGTAGALDTTRRVAFTMDHQSSDDLTHIGELVAGLAGWLTASTNAAVGRLLKLES